MGETMSAQQIKTLIMLPLLFSFATSATTSSLAAGCDSLNKVLQSGGKLKACRCFENTADGQFSMIGCTRASMPNISFSLNSLETVTVVEKVWLWDNVVPLVPVKFFDKVRPQKLVIESSMFFAFMAGALDKLGAQLQSLDLKNNIMKDLNGDDFRKLSKLVRLDLSGNRIVQLNRNSFGTIPTLETLSLASNDIAHIEDLSFSGLKNLRSLILADNHLTEITGSMFSGLDQMEFLDLQNNRISTIAKNAFTSLKKLKYLHIGGNRLSSIALSDLPELQKLFLNNNTFTTFDKIELRNLPNLVILNLDKNQLEKLPPNYFRTFGALEILSLTNNKVSELCSDSLAGLNGLRTLSLQNNAIGQLPTEVFRSVANLNHLFLSKNKLVTLQQDVFAGLSSLHVLSVAHNQLERIDANVFRKSSIEKLYLNDNKLQTLETSIISDLQKSIFALDLSDNPWNCDCRLLWLLTWLQTHEEQLLTAERLKCSQRNISEAFAKLKLECSTAATAGFENSSSWITAIGIVLGLVSLVMLFCIALLYIQDRNLSIKQNQLKRVPSDMVDLLPKGKCSKR